MTNKQRKLLDAIMDEFYRIDKSDDFLYYRISHNIDRACDFCAKDIDSCSNFDELDATRQFWLSRIKHLAEARKKTKISEFFRDCPFKSEFKLALRDLYVLVRNGEPFFTDYDFDVIGLRLVLWHLSKF